MLAEILLSLKALTPVPLTGDVTDLAPHMVWVEDHSGQLSLEQLVAKLGKGEYASDVRQVPNLGFVHHPVYFVVPIENRSGNDNFVLDIAYPLLDEVTFRVVTNRGLSAPQIAGDHIPFEQRFRPYRTINFRLDLGEFEKAILIFRVKTQSAVQMPVSVYSSGSFGDHAATESLILGLYYGLGLVMIVYNFFLYCSLRAASYLYYVIYLICLMLFQATLHGYVFQFVFPQSPAISDRLLWVWGSIAWTVALLFAIHFHELTSRFPTLTRIVRFFILIHIAFFCVNFFIPYPLAVRIGALLTAYLDTLLMLVIGLVSLSRGFRPARFFLMGWGIVVIGNVIYTTKVFGILPAHVLIENSMLICSSIEALLLSLALGDRMNLIQNERDQANRALIEGYSRLQTEIDLRAKLEQQKEALGQEIERATEQLIQADKMSTMGQLVAGVAHDIANPTQLIIHSKSDALKTVGSIEDRLAALLPSDDPEAVAVKTAFDADLHQTKSALQDITTAVDRIETIQSAIRNQARVDARTSAVAVRPLIEECLTILRSRLKPLRLELHCPADLMLECRRSQLGQVITNLLSNAVDALAEKSSEAGRSAESPDLIIRVGQSQAPQDPRNIFIEVEDNGPGIPPDRINDVFRAFFTTKAVGVGTGLGLSISQKIVVAHGGTISLKSSTRLQGACFRVDLPAVAVGKVA